jgi:hypothetical protein
MARLEQTKKGWRVVHSVTGKPLSKVFTGRGAKGRAQQQARKIRQRNQ